MEDDDSAAAASTRSAASVSNAVADDAGKLRYDYRLLNTIELRDEIVKCCMRLIRASAPTSASKSASVDIAAAPATPVKEEGKKKDQDQDQDEEIEGSGGAEQLHRLRALLTRVLEIHAAEPDEGGSASTVGGGDTVLGAVFGAPVGEAGLTVMHIVFAAEDGRFQAARMIAELLRFACSGQSAPRRRVARRAIDAILPAGPSEDAASLMRLAVGARGKPPKDATMVISTAPPDGARTWAVTHLRHVYGVFFRMRAPGEEKSPVPDELAGSLRRNVSDYYSRYLGLWFEADFTETVAQAQAAKQQRRRAATPPQMMQQRPPLQPRRMTVAGGAPPPPPPPPPRVTLLINAHGADAPTGINDTPGRGFARADFGVDRREDLMVLHFGPGICGDPAMGMKKFDPTWLREVWRGTFDREQQDTQSALQMLRFRLAELYANQFTTTHSADAKTSLRARQALESSAHCPLTNPHLDRVYDGLDEDEGINVLQIVQAFDTELFDDLVGRALFGPQVRARLALQRPEALHMVEALVAAQKITKLGHVRSNLRLSEIVDVLRAAGVGAINVVDGGCRDLIGSAASCSATAAVIERGSPGTLARMAERVDEASQVSKMPRLYGGGRTAAKKKNNAGRRRRTRAPPTTTARRRVRRAKTAAKTARRRQAPRQTKRRRGE